MLQLAAAFVMFAGLAMVALAILSFHPAANGLPSRLHQRFAEAKADRRRRKIDSVARQGLVIAAMVPPDAAARSLYRYGSIGNFRARVLRLKRRRVTLDELAEAMERLAADMPASSAEQRSVVMKHLHRDPHCRERPIR